MYTVAEMSAVRSEIITTLSNCNVVNKTAKTKVQEYAPLFADATVIIYDKMPLKMTPVRFACIGMAVGWRETRLGIVSGKGGTTGPYIIGDDGHGQGIMQIDDRWHPAFCSIMLTNSQLPLRFIPAANIAYGLGVLRDAISQFQDFECAGVDVYNAGRGKVLNAIAAHKDPDVVTTGKDYSKEISDIIVDWFKQPPLSSSPIPVAQ